jgi:hypothetical protein
MKILKREELIKDLLGYVNNKDINPAVKQAYKEHIESFTDKQLEIEHGYVFSDFTKIEPKKSA